MCHSTHDSVFTIPSDSLRNWNKDRRVEVFRVDENDNKVGDPLYVLENVKAATTPLNADRRTITSIIEGSEDEKGGILKKMGKKRPQPLWLRYEQRLEHMIVAPKCNKSGCRSNTEPMDPKLRLNIDYAKYHSLYKKWKREEETELQELCDSLGIIVKKGATKTTLLAKLQEHYNPKQK